VAEPVRAGDARIGSVLSDRYFVHSLIGEGGMGKVYAGEHVLMHKRVAIKVLHKELTALPDVVRRFEREAMAAANIDHPNVASATDFGHLPDGSVFLVLEFVQGISLRSEIADGPFAVVRALHIARQIASALASAHARGIVHRDLKPENVMLVEKAGDPDFVKVLDFGIAKVPIQEVSERGSIRPGQIITKVGMIFGTPEYMAPEQALGQEADGRADHYALGIILFEMLTGSRPYRSTNQVGMLGQQLKAPPPSIAEFAPNIVVPPGVDELIGKMLAADRDQRLENTLELVSAIEGLLLMLQPSLLIRGSRPDASPGSSALVEAPISSRTAGRVDVASEQVTVLQSDASRRRLALWADRNYPRLPRVVRQALKGLPAQVGLALVAGVGVGALGVVTGLVVVAMRTDPAVGQRRSAPSSSPVAANSHVPAKVERAPAVEVSLARASGSAALAALVEKYPTDPGIVVELAKSQFTSGDYSASVGNIARSLIIDPRAANDAEVATLIWKAVQKRECGESAFKLLEGPMGARGADILYDLATTDGVRRDIKARADEYFSNERYRAASSPALVALIGLKNAGSCEERRRGIEQAIGVGDDRLLPLLEGLRSRVGCGKNLQDDCNPCLRSSTLLEHAIEVIRQRAGS
jgi:eukaryotic-like serine/threonine-protein kinase